MQTTKGTWGPAGSAFGAGLSGWHYLGQVAGGGSFSGKGLGKSVTTGAVVGAVGGPMASMGRYYAASRVSATVGFGFSRMD